MSNKLYYFLWGVVPATISLVLNVTSMDFITNGGFGENFGIIGVIISFIMGWFAMPFFIISFFYLWGVNSPPLFLGIFDPYDNDVSSTISVLIWLVVGLVFGFALRKSRTNTKIYYLLWGIIPAAIAFMWQASYVIWWGSDNFYQKVFRIPLICFVVGLACGFVLRKIRRNMKNLSLPAPSGIKVLVFGTFDGLHKGHMDLFEQAKKFGDYLVVVVARDSTVQQNKNKDPRFNEQERLKAVQTLEMISEAKLGSEGHDPSKDRYAIIEEIKPDVICLGYDQAQFADKLKKELVEMGLQNTRVEILKPLEPEKYKSSLLNK